MRQQLLVLALVALLLTTYLHMTQVTVVQAEPLCFAEAQSQHCIDERFRAFWEHQGGLSVFGYPISTTTEEQSATGTIVVQLFERARLEHHADNIPPYDILLSHLGRQAFTLQGGTSPEPEQPRGGCHFFADVALNICPPFLHVWQNNGLELGHPGISDAESLALFGLPLTPAQPATLADGQTHTVQWFERARLEDHGAEGVLFGLLGREVAGLASPSVQWQNPYGQQEPGGFIEVSGSELTRLGQPIRLKGVNYYPQWRPWIEMWSDWDSLQMERELRLARDQLGVNAVRILLPYDAEGDGRVNDDLIRKLRHMTHIAGGLDMRLIVTLFDFYNGFPQPDSRSERKNFEYLRRLIGNFAGDERIFAWDLHNEPDHYEKWTSGRADEVLTWLGRMADEVHRIAPNHLVTVGMAKYDNLWQPGPDGRRVIDYSDVVSVHIYNAADAARQLDELRTHTSKPILLQEFGWPSGPQCSVSGYNEQQQEQMYQQTLAVAEGRVAGVFAWTLRDYDAGPTMRWDTREEHYGLYRADDSLKPAALVLRAYAAPPLPSVTKTNEELSSGRSRNNRGEKAPRLVEESGRYVKNWFRRAWDHLGGRASLGLPLSDAFVRPEDDKIVQYFEAAVLELHEDAFYDPDFTHISKPEQIMRVVRPAYTGYQYAANQEFADPSGVPPPLGEGRFFPETGYSVTGQFWPFYENFLGPWRLGAAISDEIREDIGGTAVRIQYFEKGRLEWHPVYGAVQFGQLGRWEWEQRCRSLGELP